ncbi:F0F1 ATP synthase subunit epsilon, partial [Candidatus Microgenomates bacterium]|nr:F0F1 ATP synthase subunit epsilon [Candidatus Microgenomates bacterium]
EKDKITILADYAVRSEEIEVAKAIEAQKQAEKLMKDAKEKASEKDFALAESELRRAILELKVAHRRKPKTHV